MSTPIPSIGYSRCMNVKTNQRVLSSNYVDWRRNLDTVLTVEEYKFVLNEECPLKPDEQSSDEDKLAYQKWRKADEIARCYILTSMSNVLQHQHQAMLSAFEIQENLKQMFGD
ncbi:hypothetical protein KY285_001549 [Solanum tuberosum]|nr:hypothetical protein KY285_001549 [Solanum tuberosum]